MVYSKYAWAKASAPMPSVPLVPGPDPEHLNPTSNPDLAAGQQLWVASTPAPTLPDSLTAEPFGTPIGGGGPIDRTPEDPGFGVGVGPGLTTLESQDVRGTLMSQDMGAVAARQYQALTDRDGTYHVDIIPDTPGDGASPATLVYKQTGVGQPIDPFARLGKRIKRYWDRVIDMHRYEVHPRPMYQVYASTVATRPAVANGNQLTSPFAAFIPGGGTPDSFVAPQDRRVPGDWAAPIVTDGSGQPLSGSGSLADYGLSAWGL